MGTRADFYIGKGNTSKWVGSVTHDGYPGLHGVGDLSKCSTEKQFLKTIKKLGTYIDPKEGWPWPWKTSKITDYSYYWTKEGVITLRSYHGEEFSHDDDLAPDCYGIGGLQNPNNVTTAGFMILRAC